MFFVLPTSSSASSFEEDGVLLDSALFLAHGLGSSSPPWRCDKKRQKKGTKKKKKEVEVRGIEPRASRMRSERSTI